MRNCSACSALESSSHSAIGARGAFLCSGSLCLLSPLLFLLLGLCHRFVDSSPYLAFHHCPPEATLGRQAIKVSISFYAGQRSLLFFAEQGLFQFGLAVRVCGRLWALVACNRVWQIK